MVDGIVLAGGYSSRFKQNKMTVKFKDKPLIIHTIETMLLVCSKIFVVTGFYHQEIAELLEGYSSIELIYNKNYNQGMFSSVKIGVGQVNHDFFIIPGDCPLVKEEVYQKLLLAQGDIRVPSFNHRLGHPIFMSLKEKDLIQKTEFSNLKDFRNSQDFKIVEVHDKGILSDIDTISDLDKIIGKE